MLTHRTRHERDGFRKVALTRGIAALTLVGLWPPAAQAQKEAQPTPSGSVSVAPGNPAAILEASFAAYKALKSFSCTMEQESSQASWTTNGEKAPPQTEIYTTAYQIQKPDRVAYKCVNQRGVTERVIVDGSFLYKTTTDPKAFKNRYLKVPLSAGNAYPSSAVRFIGNRQTEPLYAVMPQIVFGERNPLAWGPSFPLTLGPPAIVDGDPVDVIEYSQDYAGKDAKAAHDLPQLSRYSVTFSVSTSDRLLRRIRQEQRYTDGSVSITTETYRDVRADPPLSPALFTFRPTQGSVAVANWKGLYPEEAPKITVAPAVGVGSEPPAIAATDTDGKRVSLDAYKGKVVLLDFWATWCPPCRTEIPYAVAAYSKFHGQGFDIIGFALEDPADKGKVVSFLRQNKMIWRQVLDDGKIANGGFIPNAAGIPYTVLIGRDGRVTAVNLRGSALEAAIATALGAK